MIKRPYSVFVITKVSNNDGFYSKGIVSFFGNVKIQYYGFLLEI